MKHYLTSAVFFLLLSCNIDPRKEQEPVSKKVQVKDYYRPGLTDDAAIQLAINDAGVGGVIQLEANKTYLLQNGLQIKNAQLLQGNNATLKRAAQSVSTLKAEAGEATATLELDSIPRGWKIGDQVQLFTDSTASHSNAYLDDPVLPNIITAIKGNSITLSAPVGPSNDHSIATWPSGTYVRKVYTLLRGENINVQSAPFKVQHLNFDGNRAQNNLNYFWNVNSTIFARGIGTRIVDCTFRDIPNECIVGQGMYVSNCRAFNLNGSFVHFTGIDTMSQLPQKNAIILGNLVDSVCQICTGVTGHSEGAFTTSYTGGYATISGNRIYNCGEAAIGLIGGHSDVSDGGESDFLITNNIFKNCKQIIYAFEAVSDKKYASSDIFISGNMLSNCGVNNWVPYVEAFKQYDGLNISGNSLTNGTRILLPASFKFNEQ